MWYQRCILNKNIFELIAKPLRKRKRESEKERERGWERERETCKLYLINSFSFPAWRWLRCDENTIFRENKIDRTNIIRTNVIWTRVGFMIIMLMWDLFGKTILNNQFYPYWMLKTPWTAKKYFFKLKVFYNW